MSRYQYQQHQEQPAPTASPAAKPFAVLRLTDLRIFRFEHKDEMQDAIRAMREHDAGFVPLLWDAWGETWKMPEMWQ